MHFVPKVINALVLTVMLVSLLACGGGVSGPTFDRGEFATYFDKWKTASQAHGRSLTPNDNNVNIKFGDTHGDTHFGLCERSFLQSPVIYFDEAKWKSLDEASRESLFFHEMGHCVLGREHDEETNESRPVSLMNPNFVSGSRYTQNQEAYWTELFSR